jgi:hypothetical protein
MLAEKLLTESEKHGWEWNVDEIRRKPIAKGVAEVLSRKLERLPSNVSKGLQILSCFASRIDLKVIDAVKNYDPSENTDVALVIDVAKSKLIHEIVIHDIGIDSAHTHGVFSSFIFNRNKPVGHPFELEILIEPEVAFAIVSNSNGEIDRPAPVVVID